MIHYTERSSAVFYRIPSLKNEQNSQEILMMRNDETLDTWRRLNLHNKTFQGRPGRRLNVLCTFNLHYVYRRRLKLCNLTKKGLHRG